MYVRPATNNWLIFNKTSPTFRTYMSGMGSFMEETTQAPPIGSTMGAWVGRQQAFAVIANKCSAAQALSLKQMKETRSHEKLGLSWARLLPAPRRHQPRPTDGTIHRYEEFGDACFRLSSLARISPDYYREIAVRPGACALTAGRAS